MTRTAAARKTDEDVALEADAQKLHAAVSELVRIYQFRDRDRICCHDISVTQCYALETLVEHAPLRLNELAERLFLDKSTTSRVVNALIRKGYVDQQSDAHDRRALALSPTRAGRQLCARITNDLVEQQKELLGDLTPDVRSGVIEVLRGLARSADARFRSTGCGHEAGGSCCAPGKESCG
jgi:DNA-binding MarR family transcriptional regulator